MTKTSLEVLEHDEDRAELDSASAESDEEESTISSAVKACLAFAVLVGFAKVVFAVVARPYIDSDLSGVIEHDELPRLWVAATSTENHIGVPSDGGSVSSLGAMSILQTLIEAMVFSYAYGQSAVLLCNAVLPGRVPDSCGWVLCLLCIFAATFIMCTFATNTIHIITSHFIHFVYYGFGYLALATYRILPSACVVVAAVLWQLTTHMAMKFYVWPGYAQFPWEVLPLFNKTDGVYYQITSPQNATLIGMTRAELGWPTFLTTSFVAFPLYELINFNMATGVGYGFFIGLVVSCFAEGGLAYGSALSLSILFCAFKIFIGFGFGDLYTTLSRYYPRLWFAICCVISAVIMVFAMQRKPARHKETWEEFGDDDDAESSDI